MSNIHYITELENFNNNDLNKKPVFSTTFKGNPAKYRMGTKEEAVLKNQVRLYGIKTITIQEIKDIKSKIRRILEDGMNADFNEFDKLIKDIKDLFLVYQLSKTKNYKDEHLMKNLKNYIMHNKNKINKLYEKLNNNLQKEAELIKNEKDNIKDNEKIINEQKKEIKKDEKILNDSLTQNALNFNKVKTIDKLLNDKQNIINNIIKEEPQQSSVKLDKSSEPKKEIKNEDRVILNLKDKQFYKKKPFIKENIITKPFVKPIYNDKGEFIINDFNDILFYDDYATDIKKYKYLQSIAENDIYIFNKKEKDEPKKITQKDKKLYNHNVDFINKVDIYIDNIKKYLKLKKLKGEHKEEIKEKPKEEIKEEIKEKPKEEIKEEIKEKPKEEIKEEIKEEFSQSENVGQNPRKKPLIIEKKIKSTSKKINNLTQEKPKEEIKEKPKEEPKEQPKEEPKEQPKEEIKEDKKEDKKEDNIINIIGKSIDNYKNNLKNYKKLKQITKTKKDFIEMLKEEDDTENKEQKINDIRILINYLIYLILSYKLNKNISLNGKASNKLTYRKKDLEQFIDNKKILRKINKNNIKENNEFWGEIFNKFKDYINKLEDNEEKNNYNLVYDYLINYDNSKEGGLINFNIKKDTKKIGCGLNELIEKEYIIKKDGDKIKDVDLIKYYNKFYKTRKNKRSLNKILNNEYKYEGGYIYGLQFNKPYTGINLKAFETFKNLK